MRPLPRLALAMLAALAVSACAGGRPAPVTPSCSGPVFPLNPGLWTPAAEDLR